MSGYKPLKSLSNKHELIALLDALGHTASEIAPAVSMALGSIHRVQQDELYRQYRDGIKEQIRTTMIDRAADLLESFNSEAPEAFETLKFLHLNAVPDASRISAAKEILDRAPIAPQVRRTDRSADDVIHIHFGVQATENIQKALTDTNETDILDLLESGGGYALPGDAGGSELEGAEEPPSSGNLVEMRSVDDLDDTPGDY